MSFRTRSDYVEAHGTGTPVGDPIEASAIGNVFGEGRNPDDACIIGSIKTNIGHLEPAAGIAGLIKAALCVREGEIPPSLHFEKPNPNIDFGKLGIRVQGAQSPWPTTARTADRGGQFVRLRRHQCLRYCRATAGGSQGQCQPAGDAPWPASCRLSAASKTALPAVCGRAADAAR